MIGKELFIQGEPVPKARPRMMKTGHVYTPRATETAELVIRARWREAHGSEPTTAPVKVCIIFTYRAPKSWPKWKRLQAEGNRLPKITKPDADNLVKTVLDALNGLAYKDDSQVYSVIARKCYTSRDEDAGTAILVEAYEETWNTDHDTDGVAWYWREDGGKVVSEPKRFTQADIIEAGRWF